MLLHEASVIATKERAEMKMIDFFIAGKIVVDGAGHSITKRLRRKACWNRRTAWITRRRRALKCDSGAILQSGPIG
jgi:hypothetical protein